MNTRHAPLSIGIISLAFFLIGCTTLTEVSRTQYPCAEHMSRAEALELVKKYSGAYRFEMLDDGLVYREPASQMFSIGSIDSGRIIFTDITRIVARKDGLDYSIDLFKDGDKRALRVVIGQQSGAAARMQKLVCAYLILCPNVK